MKILVPIARVPDPARRVRLTSEGRPDTSAVCGVVNPLDAIALEAAITLRGTDAATEIVAVSVGPAICEDVLRASLARGADRAVLMVDDAPADAQAVAHRLAALARREQPDLILLGSQTSDYGSAQTGPRLAALLGLPLATQASWLEISEGCCRVTRETDWGQETLDLSLPAVVTAGQWLAQPSLISLFAIVEARAKPLEQIPAVEFGSSKAPRVTLQSLATPPPRAPVRMVADVDELITVLREEARVL